MGARGKASAQGKISPGNAGKSKGGNKFSPEGEGRLLKQRPRDNRVHGSKKKRGGGREKIKSEGKGGERTTPRGVGAKKKPRGGGKKGGESAGKNMGRRVEEGGDKNRGGV